MWSPPGPEVPILYLGALRAGVLVVPLDLRMAPQTIERIVGLADTAGWPWAPGGTRPTRVTWPWGTSRSGPSTG